MKSINLFSLHSRRKQAFVVGVRAWAQVLGLLAIFLLTTTWTVSVRSKSLTVQRAALQSQYEFERQRHRELLQLQARIVALRERETLTLRLATDRTILTTLGVVSGAQTKSNGRLYVETMTVTKAQQRTGGADDQAESFVLAIGGAGMDNLAVARFAAALRDYAVFDNVELKSAGGKQQNGRTLRSYRLECSF